MLNLDTDIRYLKGVGEKRAEQLNSLGIDTVGALLRYFPRGYADFRNVTDLFDCVSGEKVCVKAKIISPVSENRIRKNLVIYKFRISDGTGTAAVSLFNNRFLAQSLHEGSVYLFVGKYTGGAFGAEISSPEIRAENDTAVHPIYKAGAGITSKQIEKLVKTALQTCDISADVLPQSVKEKNRVEDFRTAVQNIHFPKSDGALAAAKRRFVFEELFLLRLSLMLLKGKRKRAGVPLKTDYTDEFFGILPFAPTAAQVRVTKECISDMLSGSAMNRLVEGDVGSGKTAVAAALMYTAAKNSVQSAIMAPTGILAEQHYNFLCKILKDTDINIALLTGGTKAAEKKKIKAALAAGEIQIAVGTHALITKDVEFKNLGLVITDEQHRFGVAQRGALEKKSRGVHTLVMSATPIPRTMGLIIYGDLDISVIDEYPKGRKTVKTYLVDSSYRNRVYGYIKKYLNAGMQGYIVCPAVEESENSDMLSAEEYFAELKENAFKEYRVGLLHGKMKAQDKETVMQRFKSGEIGLLVCTTVIEVGVDVPNAAIMVIENAERFGLATLHQLRGRVGRGAAQSACVLVSDASGDTKQRLNVIKDTSDGFKIADEDLRLRGPGDFLGNRQHGLPELKIADLYADGDIMRLSSMAAADLLEHDPKLETRENENLRTEIKRIYKSLTEN